jgi:hypothetical protein
LADDGQQPAWGDGEQLSELDGFVTPAKAGEMLGVSEARIRQLILAKALRHVRWGKYGLMVWRASVEQYLANRSPGHAKPGPPPGQGGRPRKDDPAER